MTYRCRCVFAHSDMSGSENPGTKCARECTVLKQVTLGRACDLHVIYISVNTWLVYALTMMSTVFMCAVLLGLSIFKCVWMRSSESALKYAEARQG